MFRSPNPCQRKKEKWSNGRQTGQKYLNLSNKDYFMIIQKANNKKQFFFPQFSECPN